jgi:hypothetical protein
MFDFHLDHCSLRQSYLLNSLYVSGLHYRRKVASGLDVSVDSRINLRMKKIYSIHRNDGGCILQFGIKERNYSESTIRGIIFLLIIKTDLSERRMLSEVLGNLATFQKCLIMWCLHSGTTLGLHF